MEAMKRLRGQSEGRGLPHHDKAPASTSLLALEFLAKHEMTIIPQPPCSPDFSLQTIFLFPWLKPTLKFRRFETIEEIREISLRDLRAILQNAFLNSKKRCKQRIGSDGEFSDGDKSS
jgi:transposase